MTSPLVPRHKNDLKALSRLQEARDEELAPLAGDLIKWLRRGDYPVTLGVVEALLRTPQEAAAEALGVMKGEDEDWAGWCAALLVLRLPLHLQVLFLPDLDRLARSRSESAREAATEAIETIKRRSREA